MVLVPDGHERMPMVIAHSNNNHHSLSHFPYKCIVAFDTSTCINTLSGFLNQARAWFPNIDPVRTSVCVCVCVCVCVRPQGY